MDIQFLIPVLGILGLVVMIFKAIWVGKQDPGDANMVELAGYIARGAQAFCARSGVFSEFLWS